MLCEAFKERGELNMRTIYLFCNQGMSTSMMVKKMREAAASIGYETEIAAWPLADISVRASEADMILLGPQVRFQVKKVAAQFPDKKVDSIDMRAYGMMDGKSVIEFVKKQLGD